MSAFWVQKYGGRVLSGTLPLHTKLFKNCENIGRSPSARRHSGPLHTLHYVISLSENQRVRGPTRSPRLTPIVPTVT